MLRMLGTFLVSSYVLIAATMAPATQWPADGPCLRFDGLDDALTVPYDASLPAEQFTVSAWVRLLSPGTAGSTIVSRNEDETSDNAPWTLLEGGGLLGVQIEDASDVDALYMSSYRIVDRHWHQVAATRALNGTLTLYVDGVSVYTAPNTLIPSSNNTQILSIGFTRSSEGGPVTPQPPHGYVDGFLAEVTVWNRALSAAEIVDLSQTPADSSGAGLVGYWRLEDGVGQVPRRLTFDERRSARLR